MTPKRRPEASASATCGNTGTSGVTTSWLGGSGRFATFPRDRRGRLCRESAIVTPCTTGFSKRGDPNFNSRYHGLADAVRSELQNGPAAQLGAKHRRQRLAGLNSDERQHDQQSDEHAHVSWQP